MQIIKVLSYLRSCFTDSCNRSFHEGHTMIEKALNVWSLRRLCQSFPSRTSTWCVWRQGKQERKNDTCFLHLFYSFHSTYTASAFILLYFNVNEILENHINTLMYESLHIFSIYFTVTIFIKETFLAYVTQCWNQLFIRTLVWVNRKLLYPASYWPKQVFTELNSWRGINPIIHIT